MSSKAVTLVKQTNMIQLGHLYEHLYCGYLEQFFFSHKVYPYLDYKLTGRTYYGGVIYIECIFYTEKAAVLADQISTITPDFSEDSIYTHFSQIIAEHHKPFSGLGIEKITEELMALQNKPWEPIDSYQYTDFKSLRTKTGPVYIAEGKEWNPKKVHTTLSLSMSGEANNRALLPLFRQLTLFINASLQSAIPFAFGYFSHDDTFTVKPRQATFTNTYYVDKDQDVYLEEVGNTVMELIRNVLAQDTLERFLNEFQTISYKDRPFSAPDIGATYEETLFLVGAKGWREIATHQNIHNILNHMSVSVRHGSNRVSYDLSQL